MRQPRRLARTIGWLLACLLLALPTAPPAASQGVGHRVRHRFPLIPDTVAVPPNDVVGIISGGLSGTYVRIAADIASVFAARDPQLRILPIVGVGSLQNISDILNIRDVDVGIVQSDVLSFLRARAATAGLESNICYLAKLYDEEVHILARANVANIGALGGKTVDVDALGSGTALTASVIFDAIGVKPLFAHDDPETALGKLERGEIDALVYVTGKPARLFTDASGHGLHLLALPLNAALLQTYLPSSFSHADYPALVPEHTTIDTVAVGAVMAVYNWPVGSARYLRLQRFVDALFADIATLQQPPHHPKWKQLSLTAQVPGWNRFRAAELWLRHNEPTPKPAKP